MEHLELGLQHRRAIEAGALPRAPRPLLCQGIGKTAALGIGQDVQLELADTRVELLGERQMVLIETIRELMGRHQNCDCN